MTAEEIYKQLDSLETMQMIADIRPAEKRLLDLLIEGAFVLGQQKTLDEVAPATARAVCAVAGIPKHSAVDAAVTGPGIAPPE